MSGKKRIYIAGPNLFYANWPTFASQAQTLCAEHGLEAILPVPATVLTGPGVTESSNAEAANKVFQACLNAVRSADGVIANLSSFRGSEPDSGTVVECAVAHTLGIPVIGYTNGDNPLIRSGTDAEGRVLAEDGGWIEQFGLSHNVMLHGVCLAIVEDPREAVSMMAELLERRKKHSKKAVSVD
ncbi:nucleoside 2-deoxyribosyltransferase [Acidithiobacillus ferrooxidans]|uniref:Nucleoside 2-deoxyribosyltransferase family protein n=1 Tax=Acidithiobacillus ferrooxidans (strain ATCC 23270 / DSM 14882 / CIP 104768 / NCIMB 8455) TaxID=243159 RepID=B7J875_ACIF2|nr:nucleoside 2-deoxyribosyltransferase [Acidithiobacillus ferrooxidans]ACK80123.1 nucleoside 2-deoxyribosyltransferase family protein [Acidithiobacillus ferrooxidans ATCC 23270]